MGWIETYRRRKAAKRFARRLPGLLASQFWSAKTYTPAQVRSALEQGKLGGRYVAIAYAGCVTEDDYTGAVVNYPVMIPYADAGALFQQYRRSSSSVVFHPADDRYAGGAGGGSPD